MRASLVASHIIGVALVGSVWEIEPLATIDDDRLVALLAPTIERNLVEPLPIGGVGSSDITDGGNA